MGWIYSPLSTGPAILTVATGGQHLPYKRGGQLALCPILGKTWALVRFSQKDTNAFREISGTGERSTH